MKDLEKFFEGSEFAKALECIEAELKKFEEVILDDQHFRRSRRKASYI